MVGALKRGKREKSCMNTVLCHIERNNLEKVQNGQMIGGGTGEY